MENKKDRLAKEGASKTKINNLTKLDVIFDDVKLAEIPYKHRQGNGHPIQRKNRCILIRHFKGGRERYGNNQKLNETITSLCDYIQDLIERNPADAIGALPSLDDISQNHRS
ncbi:hypothetical protein P7H12_20110 [Paenibacillus larvae]|nr:hypothetical protein [Paenibacillus larvae]MDT2265421.1 hypothetical protein [Paenibacillus larvae]